MNYNVFTKVELIDAIKSAGDESFWIDEYLINLWNNKTKNLLKEIAKNDKEMIQALKNIDQELYYKLLKKSKKLNKENDRLTKL